jgi:hypothetical protein
MGVRTELLINGTWITPAISAVSSTRLRAPRAKLMRAAELAAAHANAFKLGEAPL